MFGIDIIGSKEMDPKKVILTSGSIFIRKCQMFLIFIRPFFNLFFKIYIL